MHLIDIPLECLRDAPQNANRMGRARFDQLVESIRRNGFVVPLLVRELDAPEYELIDGHHRRDAAKIAGLTSVPSVVFDEGEDPRLVALALNRLRGDTDLSVAADMISDLVEGGADLSSLLVSGFTESELSELIAASRHEDPDLDDLAMTEMPAEVGAPVARPFLLELVFRNKEELNDARKALRKACGKGGNMADGLLRLVRG